MRDESESRKESEKKEDGGWEGSYKLGELGLEVVPGEHNLIDPVAMLVLWINAKAKDVMSKPGRQRNGFHEPDGSSLTIQANAIVKAYAGFRNPIAANKEARM